MKEIKDLQACTKLAEMYPYYKADVFSSCLIEAGFSPEQVIISRRKGLDQGFLFDIEKVSVKYPYLYPDHPFLDIESGRPGMYDSLPEDLFYAPDHSGRERDKHQIIQRMRTNKQAEISIRRSLQLFEVEADRFLCNLRTKELKYDKRHTYDEFVSVFRQHWEVIASLSAYESLRFLKVVPHIHSLRGNYEAGAEALSFILNLDAKFQLIYLPVEKDAYHAPALSDMRLDDNSILAPWNNDQRVAVVRVTLSGLDIEACTGFFQGKKREQALRYLIDLFLEVNTPVEIEIIPKAECREFLMGDSTNEAYLGINTYL